MRTIALSYHEENAAQAALTAKSSGLAKVQRELAAVRKNMARAKTDNQYSAIAVEFESLKCQEAQLEAEISQLSAAAPPPGNPESEVAAALGLLDQVVRLSKAAAEDFSAARKLFDLVNARLFLRFSQGQWGKRTINKIAGGAMTFGETEPPVVLYQGKTGRVAIQQSMQPKHEQPHQCGEAVSESADEEDNSLGNVSRGDRI